MAWDKSTSDQQADCRCQSLAAHALLLRRQEPSLAIHAFHPRDVIPGREPVFHVPARATDMEHWFDRREDVPSAHANDVSRPPLFTLPRNLNDVARLALRALLRVLHHRCSAPRTTGYSNCHAGAGPEASQRSGDTRCRTVESLQAPQFPLLAHRLANVFGSTPPTPRAHATPRRSSHAEKLSRCQLPRASEVSDVSAASTA